MKNVNISSKSRALTFDQVYEAHLDGVTLNDRQDAHPFTIMGADSGAIYVDDSLKNRIHFGTGLSDAIINPEDKQVW